MFDGNMGRKKWNVTFYDYSAREADEAYGKKVYCLLKGLPFGQKPAQNQQ